MSDDVRMRLRSALSRTTARLGEAGIVSSSAESRTLIEAAARADGPLVMLDALPEDFDARLEELVARRERREPLQLILGRAPFRRLQLATAPGVFIPRPETELAIDLLLEHARSHDVRTVVDLCTGSGALAAAVLDEMPAARVLALEIDPAARDLAEQNLAAVDPERGAVRAGDVEDARLLADPEAALGALAGGVDAVLANPPYIPADAIPRDQEVREHDPARALFGGGEDGLDVPRSVVALAARLLRPGGLLVMEHADVQGSSTRALAHGTGSFTDIRTVRDLTDRDRFLVALRADPSTPSTR
ncbi:peptide chain release factor N(5)-glutamine methyltransferase [Brachybacterium halotolerans subsp. kimchii]|uniref:peptide chain release factor N(5)-glutamine methyltransferase n=1 Tax=Brachybacterium halotolerans TaxID=2795215 RepID=UPI001E4C6789|nr:peptide chain release factor N(5)-glutamine methyltransferase [Brachybacterium halotolerans]UEJ82871.1 peptide chain release factor N(5)-glutamine methyltransferase [Brachybacterium halotolerans subsp. kimchii]